LANLQRFKVWVCHTIGLILCFKLKFPYKIHIIFIFSFFWVAIAQKPTLHFSGIKVNKDINDPKIWSIHEDARGFMYFGGEGGLYRYNSFNIQNFQHDDNNPKTLSNNRVFSMLLDNNGLLWLGTGSGLNVYDYIKDEFFHYNNSGKFKCLKNASGSIKGLSKEINGAIWYVDKQGGLGRVSSQNEVSSFFKYTHSQGKYVEYKTTMIDPQNNVWVGTNLGLLKFNKVKQRLESEYVIDNVEFDVQSLVYSKDVIWIGTYNGLFKYDLTTKKCTKEAGDGVDEIVSSILPYKNGLLLGFDGAGIKYYDFDTKNSYSYNSVNNSMLNCDNIITLYLDRVGSIWVGTYMHGINVSNLSTNFSPVAKNKVLGNSASSIVNGIDIDKEGTMWMVTDRYGVYYKKAKTDQFHKLVLKNSSLNLDNVACTDVEVFGDKVLIATWGLGVLCLDKNQNITVLSGINNNPNLKIINNRVRCITFDKQRNILWLGYFGSGVGMYDLNSNKMTHFAYNPLDSTSLCSNWINKLLIDAEGHVWVATVEGLSLYDRHLGYFRSVRFLKKGKFNQSYNHISDVQILNKNAVVLATDGAGIIKIRNGDFKNPQYIDSYFSKGEQMVKSILVTPNGELWFTTPHTLNRFTDSTLKDLVRLKTNDERDQMVFNRAVNIIDNDGSLYFGTNNGFMMVNPKQYLKNNSIPPVFITKVSVQNNDNGLASPGSLKEFVITDKFKKIELPARQNNIYIDFAALNFVSPSNNIYKYKLEGADKAWHIENNPKTVSYFNLSPGKYEFRVFACNNDGVWNSQGDTVSIEILKPWWLKTWFLVLLFLLILALGYFLLHQRMWSIQKQKLKLEKAVEKGTMELQTANSTLETLLYRTSHDIKGPVKSILGLVKIGKEEFVTDEKFKIYLNHISKAAHKLDVIMSELSLISNHSFTTDKEIIDFRKTIDDTLAGLDLPSDFEVVYQIKTEEQFFSYTKSIYSIFQNLIQNSYVFRDANKSISFLNIEIKAENDKLILVFGDNGEGIESDKLDKVFDMFYRGNVKSEGSGLGLYVVKTLVNKLGGEVSLVSSYGIGTEVILTLPLK
jgi:signal transduction histidine kinase/ligand-binding sensor domain-containing protein